MRVWVRVWASARGEFNRPRIVGGVEGCVQVSGKGGRHTRCLPFLCLEMKLGIRIRLLVVHPHALSASYYGEGCPSLRPSYA